jgi:hypothetical protein
VVTSVFSWFRASADVSGVGHPVSGGGALPGDCDADVNAERPGKDRGGEGEQGGSDADLLKGLAESAGRLAVASARV